MVQLQSKTLNLLMVCVIMIQPAHFPMFYLSYSLFLRCQRIWLYLHNLLWFRCRRLLRRLWRAKGLERRRPRPPLWNWIWASWTSPTSSNVSAASRWAEAATLRGTKIRWHSEQVRLLDYFSHYSKKENISVFYPYWGIKNHRSWNKTIKTIPTIPSISNSLSVCCPWSS